MSDSSAGKGRVGSILGRKWRVEARLGSGSSATVYRAEHWNNGRKVAVKVLHADRARSAESRGRFLREGRLANSVDHEGVVGVIDDGETDDGCPFIIMELVEGETLDEYRRARPEGRLPIREVLNTCLDVLDVLAAAHAAGVVHRDVKPRNILVATSGQLKLVDFGIAGAAESDGISVTRTAAGLGTPLFMAPEQVTGERAIDAHSDIWGVGAVLYVLASGRFPFQAILLTDYVTATRSPPPRLDVIVPGIPSVIGDIVERALAFEPTSRWPSARAMADALEAVVLPSDGKPATAFADETEPMVTLLRGTAPPSGASTSRAALPLVVSAPHPRASMRTTVKARRRQKSSLARVVASALGGALLALVAIAILVWAFASLRGH